MKSKKYENVDVLLDALKYARENHIEKAFLMTVLEHLNVDIKTDICSAVNKSLYEWDL